VYVSKPKNASWKKLPKKTREKGVNSKSGCKDRDSFLTNQIILREKRVIFFNLPKPSAQLPNYQIQEKSSISSSITPFSTLTLHFPGKNPFPSSCRQPALPVSAWRYTLTYPSIQVALLPG
jgi:hypothetical protein